MKRSATVKTPAPSHDAADVGSSEPCGLLLAWSVLKADAGSASDVSTVPSAHRRATVASPGHISLTLPLGAER